MTPPAGSSASRQRQRSSRIFWTAAATTLGLHALGVWAFIHFSPTFPSKAEQLITVSLQSPPQRPTPKHATPKAHLPSTRQRPQPQVPVRKPSTLPITKPVELPPTPQPQPTEVPAPTPTVPFVRVAKVPPTRTTPLIALTPQPTSVPTPVQVAATAPPVAPAIPTTVPRSITRPLPSLPITPPNTNPTPLPSKGEGVGKGQGDGTGTGSGQGSGTGSGRGSGNGSGTGSVTGAGKGSGEGKGEGVGKGTGQGDGTGQDDGKGTGQGKGDGNGNGNGPGNGSGGNGGGGSHGGGGGGGGGGNGSPGGGNGGGGPYGTGGRRPGEPPRHIVYVLDASPSMEPRIERAENELRKALADLQPGEWFDIIAFSNAARRFKKQLLPANADNVAQANQWLDRIQLDYGTDLGKAMKQAFSLRGVNVIVIITDGVPTMGELKFDKLATQIRNLNQGRARIDTVGLKGDNPPDEETGDTGNHEFEATQLLQQIARESGGEFKVVPD